ncbi:MAG: LamG domain-containing protein, partial [Thermoflexales bacterium]|nr:LamG domain-containing protein [Thermoflexales bacterium]
ASPDSALVDRVKTSIGLKGGVVNEFVKDIADSGYEALARAVSRGNPTFLTGSAFATTSFNVPLGNTQLTASQKFQEFLGKGFRGLKDKWTDAFTPNWARTNATTATRAQRTGSKVGGGLMTVGALGAVSLSVWGATRQGGEGLSTANQALNGLHVVLALKGSLDIINKVATGGLAAGAPATVSLRSLTSASLKAGVVGLIVSTALGWGAFAYQVGKSGLQFGSLAFNAALAEVIAATVVAVILFAITLIPVVGQIIAAVIGLIDAVITAVCGAVGSDFSENNAFGKRFCKGLSGLTAELIKGLIYSSRTLVGNLTKGDRLQISGFDTTLVDANKGFASDNQLSYQINVTNTLILNGLFDDTSSDEFKDRVIPIPFDWKALSYFWQYNVSNLKTATFDYKLQTSKTDFHDGVKRKTMDGSWQSVPGQSDAIFIAKSVSAAQSPLQDTGINRPVQLFLSEAYAVPVQECWAVPVPLMPPVPYVGLIPICYINTDSATQHIDLGQNLKYDVFPATLDAFYTLSAKDGGYSLAWGQSGDATFARQLDADGDGLLNPIDGGSDPDDSRWDADLDGLGDAYELSIGSSPIKADTDGDGLLDADEAVLGTNPLKQDTDGDGLTDKEEQTGWEFVYGFTANGTPLRTWFTSDPLQADSDQDGLTDFQEKTFGFNPRAVSNPQVLTYESSVREVSAPRLLLRLEEANGASTFADASGYINPVTCSSTACPVAAVQGRFGTAALFDGANDVITLNDFSAFETNRVSAVTVAAWVNPADYVGYSPIVAQENNAGAGYWLNLSSNGTIRFIVGNLSTNLDLSTVSAIPLNQWSHVAGTYDGSTVRIYINGVEAANAAFTGGMIVPHKTVRIGSDVAPNGYFSGRLDEVAVFDRALTATEISVLMNARYNPNDAVVKPGDTLAYSATVKNELFNRYANGLLSADFPAAVDSSVAPTTFVLQPLEATDMAGNVQVKSTATSGVANLNLVAGALINDRREASNFAETWLRFEESGAATTFADVSGNLPPRNGTCSGVTCPTTGQAGAAGYAAQFNGSQFATVNDIDLANKSLTVAFWA